jgi:D-alanine-D-alanine ligase-like ATP-grasp enzyme
VSEPGFHQYFGPSPRHERACIELRFAIGDATYRLAPFEPLLFEAGFKLRETLPDEPLPLDAAVARLAGAMIARHARWWSSHGTEDGTGWAALAYPYPIVSALALRTAFGLLQSGTAPPAVATDKLGVLAKQMSNISQIKMRIIAVAEARGLATAQLNSTSELYQIGQGAKGRHFYRSSNDGDALTGMKLEQSKDVTVDTLRRMGLPTTNAVLVKNQQQVREAIGKVGLPCVVKPVALFQGRGVATRLQSEAQVDAAVTHALKLSGGPLLIENHVEGHDHRVMVAGDQFMWAYRRIPASVTGDGEATVQQLVERENRRRAGIRGGTEAYLYPIALDEELRRLVHDRHGLALDGVVERGRRIEVSAQANIARGGELEDVTGLVHPDNRALALRASRLFKIRTMGIDFITPDISRSWKEIPCAIIEVNRVPSLWGAGDTALVLRALLPNALSGRIPNVAVVGDERYRAAMAEALRAAFAHHRMRLVTAEHVGGPEAQGGLQKRAVPPAIEALLLDPESDAAAVLCDPAYVESAGLPLARCDLLVREDETPLAWLEQAAETALRGAVSQAKIDHAVARLARRYGDPAEGGPLPLLEPVAGPEGEFRLRVSRPAAKPRGWFWEQLGVEAVDTPGLTTEQDLLVAVHALAGRDLASDALPEFTHGELPGSWVRETFEAAIALPAKKRDEARIALLAATERVNAIATAKS